MKKIMCDECGSENAKTYEYEGCPTRTIYLKDLCVSCLQDFVLKNKVKLTEVGEQNSGKRIIHG
jgi:hypothetical protein